MTGNSSRLAGLAAALAIVGAAAGALTSNIAAGGTTHKASSQKDGPKTYRWVDKDGVVHFGDSVPPEYASSDRQVINEYGVAVSKQGGAKTPEELEAENAAAKAAEEERKKAILAAHRDQVLLDTYLSVQDIEALRDRRLELIDTQIKVTENYLQGLRDILQKLQGEAAAYQPYSTDPKAPPIDEKLAKELSNTMDSIMLYEKSLEDTKQRRADVTARFASDISRFRELKATARE